MNTQPLQSDYHVIMVPAEKKQPVVFYDDAAGCAITLIQVSLILALIAVIIWALVTLL